MYNELFQKYTEACEEKTHSNLDDNYWVGYVDGIEEVFAQFNLWSAYQEWKNKQ